MAIYRNYKEQDPLRKKIQYFVHYKFLPGLGFYGFGLIHMVGGLAKSATSLLRQLVDAGTLSNLPGGLKTRGLRIKGDDTPIYPGEFRDVDVPGGSIRDNITFLPYKEPSGTLYQLLGNIVEEGRRFASITDLKVSDMNNQAPVGTTLALLERNMKVMGAIQARLHASMRQELRILSDIIKVYMPAEYEYEIDGDQAIKASDFDERVDIIPVSDPNAATMAQRIMQYQAALQLATQVSQVPSQSALSQVTSHFLLSHEDLSQVLVESAVQHAFSHPGSHPSSTTSSVTTSSVVVSSTASVVSLAQEAINIPTPNNNNKLIFFILIFIFKLIFVQITTFFYFTKIG